ncbi:DNA protecting protein DprA [Rhodoferax sp. OV413]|uniref:DNA-processing protein DprA n=1 Tax=Rhodoferax sp. OV413 TaxID=1855285 RepID=UPI00088124E3|nr:DNA-processing protein DprA [Rhodoferax sp. OV413]SDO79023.1 DNA protecting protein DprA [Rhodoferax sp. OV413]
MERDELAAWLQLLLTPGIGNEAARRLLAAFGLPQAVFAQSQASLQQVVPPAYASALLQTPPELAVHLEATAQWLAQAEAAPRSLITLGDARYPTSLLAMADPPLLLFALGRIDLWQADNSQNIAIVGSRNPTPQGEANARQFAKACAQAGLTVVSGLALGVDSAAHQGALEGAAAGQLATIAFVGTGLDRVYPKRNLALAHQIASHGLLLSEYLLGTPPLPGNFPKRNRLIAGLAQGTLVVEAALQSGSLITARLASEQGKEVFAIPGSIHAPQARGCHALIKQGAKLVENIQDVLDELQLQSTTDLIAASADTESAEGQNNAENPLLMALGFDPVGLDALVARTGIAPAQLQVQLLELELDNQVARLPGGLFQRMGRA